MARFRPPLSAEEQYDALAQALVVALARFRDECDDHSDPDWCGCAAKDLARLLWRAMRSLRRQMGTERLLADVLEVEA